MNVLRAIGITGAFWLAVLGGLYAGTALEQGLWALVVGA